MSSSNGVEEESSTPVFLLILWRSNIYGKTHFLELQSRLLPFKDVIVQLKHSAKTDNIAMAYLAKGFDLLYQTIDMLQRENEELQERIYVLEKENKTLQDMNDSLSNLIH